MSLDRSTSSMTSEKREGKRENSTSRKQAQSAGAHRRGQLQIRTETILDLHRRIPCADRQFLIAPRGQSGHTLASHGADAVHDAVIETNQAEPAAAWSQIQCQVMKPRKGLEVFSGHAPVFDTGSRQ